MDVFSDGIAPELDDLRPDGLRIFDIKKLKEIIGFEKQKGLSLESPSAKIVGPCGQAKDTTIPQSGQ